MSNNSSTFSSPSKQALKPNQHVNFTLGMVLGEDDFNQEFTYLSGHDQWLARDLLGYGTVCGLKVSINTEDKKKGPYVEVDPGVALSPRGQLIRVDSAQCAYLNTWITDQNVQSKLLRDKGIAAILKKKAELAQKAIKTGKNTLGIGKKLGGASKIIETDSMTLYLTLCYRECFTDDRPVPGEPCRTEAEGDLLKPARIQDDFSLELNWDPPDQQEENALRDFVAWLRQVKVSETADQSTSLDNFAKALRKAAESPDSPPTDFLYGNPPADLKIPGSQACEYLRLAFRIWATELRPMWRGLDASCVTPTGNDCVLLAILRIPISYSETGEWAIAIDGQTVMAKLVDETTRPYLIHLRMLQEWMTCGRDAVLTPADTVTSEMAFDQPSNPGSSELYSRGDHTHGTPPTPELLGDITGKINKTFVAKLQGTPVSASEPANLKPGNVLTLKKAAQKVLGETGLEWSPEPLSLPDLDGEVTGPATKNRVASIQTLPVSAKKPSTPKAGQVLMLHVVNSNKLPGKQSGNLPAKVSSGSASSIKSGVAITEPGLGNVNLPGVVEPKLTSLYLEWQAQDLPAATLPNLDGDVINSPIQNMIKKLQGKLVDALNPDDNQVLTFKKADEKNKLPERWVAATPQASTGAFVTRPQTAGAFGIVAAGVCRFDSFDPNNTKCEMLSAYNQLSPMKSSSAGQRITLQFSFKGYSFSKSKPPMYIVKLTPCMWEDDKYPFMAFVGNFTGKYFNVGIQFFDNTTGFSGHLMIEISQFEPDPA